MKIFIDPGHNYSGFDTGASGNGLREQDITFQIAEKLSKLLKNIGFEIKMSRNKMTDNLGRDESSSLNKRASLANEFKADYFISLHTDSSTNKTAKGSHICVYKKGSESEGLANKINVHLLNLGLSGRSELISERPDVHVLRETSMPAILIEMGFISNTRDADIQKNNQDSLANAIFFGICDYLGMSYSNNEDMVTPISPETTIKIDGKVVNIDFTSIDDSIYVPIRKFCDLIGYGVNWNDITKEVNISSKGKVDVDNKVVNSSQNTVATAPISPTKYSIIGATHVIEIDPRNIWHVETQKLTNQTPYNNFVNSLFFQPQKNGIMFPQGMAVNDGKILSNYATHGKPVATLVCYGWNDVQLKYIADITKEKDVWFAVSGYGIYPKITAENEGFSGKFSDVLRTTNRPIIGYRKSDNKIVIAVRAGSDATRAKETAKNLNLDFAISLDAGGSTTLKVNGAYKFKGDGRQLWGGITWG